MKELQKHTIPELKLVAKKYQLKVSGSKQVLIQRIQEYFDRENSCIRIQRTFRAHMVRYLFRNLGPAHRNRALCVNECDGCTLEPLSSVPFQRFFSCIDEKGFVYGFDIISLLTLHKKSKMSNPYTREPMSREMVNKICTLGRLILLLFPELIDKGERDVIDLTNANPPVLRRTRRTQNTQNQNNLYIPQYNAERNRNIIFNTATVEPNGMGLIYRAGLVRDYLTEQEQIILNKLLEVKRLPLEQRIREIFIEIDILGNYTQSTWFSTLSSYEYCHFFRHLYEIWNFRANLSPEIKRRICILYDPFLNTRLPPTSAIIINPDAYLQTLQEICITVIENIVYGSPDPEYRKIGTMHVLTALTIVSRDARHNLYWLYESVV